ncbi:MAG: HD domain-containing phosphohydrolase [Planctomycetaceae bacterium]
MSPHFPIRDELDDLARGVVRERVALDGTGRDDWRVAWERLARQFKQRDRAAAALFNQADIDDIDASHAAREGNSEYPVAGRWRRQAEDLGRLLREELRRFDDPARTLAPLELVERLIELHAGAIAGWGRHRRLLDETAQHARTLHGLVTELRRGASVASPRFWNLARGLLIEGADHPAATFALPELGRSLARPFPSPRFVAEAEVYAAGIQAARLIGAIGARGSARAEDIEALAVAALLHDVGLIEPGGRHRLPPSKLALKQPERFRAHPEWGAALVAGLENCPVDPPSWIARHHERLDGTGFPGRAAAARITPPARRLAVVARFVELLHDGASERTVPDAERFPWWSAAERLHAEARRGELDDRCVRELLGVLDDGLPDSLSAAPIRDTSATEVRIGDRVWRLDAAHAALRGTSIDAARDAEHERSARAMAGDPRRAGSEG